MMTLGYHRFHARRKPDLTERHKKLRVEFCKTYQHWDQERWQHVLWSNEAVFTVTGSARGGVYHSAGRDMLLPQYVHCSHFQTPTIHHGVGLLLFSWSRGVSSVA